MLHLIFQFFGIIIASANGKAFSFASWKALDIASDYECAGTEPAREGLLSGKKFNRKFKDLRFLQLAI
jgi:hypothetical protein